MVSWSTRRRRLTSSPTSSATPGRAALVADARLAPAFAPRRRRSPHLATAIVFGAAPRPTLPGLRVRWDEALAEEHRAAPPRRRDIDIDLAAIVYTSGSTGEPKGVMLTHRNMLAAAASITAYLENVEDDVILGVLAALVRLRPLPDDHGLPRGRPPGARALVRLPGASARDPWSEEGVTGFPGVPTMFAILAEMKRPPAASTSARVRYVTNTAAALAGKHIAALEGIFPGARALLDVRPHRVQALHVPAARGSRTQAGERRHRHPEHRALDRRRARQPRSAPARSGSS